MDKHCGPQGGGLSRLSCVVTLSAPAELNQPLMCPLFFTGISWSEPSALRVMLLHVAATLSYSFWLHVLLSICPSSVCVLFASQFLRKLFLYIFLSSFLRLFASDRVSFWDLLHIQEPSFLLEFHAMESHLPLLAKVSEACLAQI